MSVLGTSTFGSTMNCTTPAQGGGHLRIIASITGNEASIGYFSRSGSRANIAGGMWVSGINCWSRTGYNIGTPTFTSCL